MPPAARMGDSTEHGGKISGPCAATVEITRLKAARITDMHNCPMSTGTVAHVGGPIAKGSATVQIEFQPAARIGDIAVCVGPVDKITTGAANVFIGG